jgi:Lon protease-like protein
MAELCDRDVLPLFPLPDFVLFPNVHVPLNIFEPRYCEMIAEALDGSGTFCMGTLVGDWQNEYEGDPDFHQTGCVCRLIDYERHPDGRYNVLAEGIARVQITEVTSKGLYRSVEIMTSPVGPVVDANGSIKRLREVGADALVQVIGKAPDGLAERMHSIDLPTFINLLAFHLPLDVSDKLALLDMPNGDTMIERLLQHCERLHA